MLSTLKSKFSKRQKVKCFIYGCEEYCNNNKLRSLTLGKQFRSSDCVVVTIYSRVKFETSTERIKFKCYEQHVSLRYFSVLKNFFESFRRCNVSLFVVDMSARVEEQLEKLQSFINFALPNSKSNQASINTMPLILVAFALDVQTDFTVLDDFDQQNCFQEVIKIFNETDTADHKILKSVYYAVHRNIAINQKKTENLSNLRSHAEVEATKRDPASIDCSLRYDLDQRDPSCKASSSCAANEVTTALQQSK